MHLISKLPRSKHFIVPVTLVVVLTEEFYLPSVTPNMATPLRNKCNVSPHCLREYNYEHNVADTEHLRNTGLSVFHVCVHTVLWCSNMYLCGVCL